MRIVLITLFINLWITSSVWAWGDLGHRVVAEYGTALVDQSTLNNCQVTASQLVSHTNDPDKIWRQQRRKHPDENIAHFFHVDKQPGDWRSRKAAADKSQGLLVYRIVDWIEHAKKLRQSKDWDELAQKLYGLSHYVGDLTQPLHLHHDYDGDAAGLPDIHSQFETKMVNRYEDEIRSGVRRRLLSEKIPALWSKVELKNLIFDTAQQSYSKAPRFFESARPALQMPKQSKKMKASGKKPKPRFVKKVLWEKTGTLAQDQLALAARLWAHVLNSVCSQ